MSADDWSEIYFERGLHAITTILVLATHPVNPQPSNTETNVSMHRTDQPLKATSGDYHSLFIATPISMLFSNSALLCLLDPEPPDMQSTKNGGAGNPRREASAARAFASASWMADSLSTLTARRRFWNYKKCH